MHEHADRDKTEPPPCHPKHTLHPVTRGRVGSLGSDVWEPCNTPDPQPRGEDAAALTALADALDTTPAELAAGPTPDGTDGHRRGPSGYRCCQHCKEDTIHDVTTDSHDVPCQTCDDPGAMARELHARTIAELETLRARDADLCAALRNMDRLVTEANAAAETAEATVARVEKSLHAWQIGPWNGSTRHLLKALEAALEEPESCPHTCSCTSDMECPHDCPCDGA